VKGKDDILSVQLIFAEVHAGALSPTLEIWPLEADGVVCVVDRDAVI
jgi:hypothetical protein